MHFCCSIVSFLFTFCLLLLLNHLRRSIAYYLQFVVLGKNMCSLFTVLLIEMLLTTVSIGANLFWIIAVFWNEIELV